MVKKTISYRLDECTEAVIETMFVSSGAPKVKRDIAMEAAKKMHNARPRIWSVEEDAKFILNHWPEITLGMAHQGFLTLQRGKLGICLGTREEVINYNVKYLTSFIKTHNRRVEIIKKHGGSANFLAMVFDFEGNFDVVEVDKNPYASQDEREK